MMISLEQRDRLYGTGKIAIPLTFFAGRYYKRSAFMAVNPLCLNVFATFKYDGIILYQFFTKEYL